MERESASAKVKKSKASFPIPKFTTHLHPLSPPMKSTTAGFLWLGILDTLEAFHSHDTSDEACPVAP